MAEEKKPETGALVTLSGTTISESKLTKSNYFRFLQHNLDDYGNVQLSPQEAERVHRHLQKLSTGSTAMVPMWCKGPACPVAERCPLQQMNKAPIGKQCIIEVSLMKEWIIRYFEEFDVDPDNFTEVGYVNELADLMIQEMRLNMLLAKPANQEMLIDQVMGVDRDGDPIIQKQVSPYIEMKEKISNRRSKIIKLMVGDRQEKYKKEAALKVRLDDDPSSQMALMRSRLENLQRELNTASIPKQLEETSKKVIMTPEDLIASED